jgi:hypothetical protein
MNILDPARANCSVPEEQWCHTVFSQSATNLMIPPPTPPDPLIQERQRSICQHYQRGFEGDVFTSLQLVWINHPLTSAAQHNGQLSRCHSSQKPGCEEFCCCWQGVPLPVFSCCVVLHLVSSWAFFRCDIFFSRMSVGRSQPTDPRAS